MLFLSSILVQRRSKAQVGSLAVGNEGENNTAGTLLTDEEARGVPVATGPRPVAIFSGAGSQPLQKFESDGPKLRFGTFTFSPKDGAAFPGFSTSPHPAPAIEVAAPVQHKAFSHSPFEADSQLPMSPKKPGCAVAHHGPELQTFFTASKL